MPAYCTNWEDRSGYLTSIPRYQKVSGRRSSRIRTTSHASAHCARVRCPRNRGRPYGVPKAAVVSVRTHLKVCHSLCQMYDRATAVAGTRCALTRLLMTENAVTRCVKCKAAIINADAVLDALRVGQDALEKASSLELKGKTRRSQLPRFCRWQGRLEARLEILANARPLHTYIIHRPRESPTIDDEHNPDSDFCRRHAVFASLTGSDAAASGAADCVTGLGFFTLAVSGDSGRGHPGRGQVQRRAAESAPEGASGTGCRVRRARKAACCRRAGPSPSQQGFFELCHNWQVPTVRSATAEASI